ncbi:MAG: TIR domain-containing protein [Achromobacter marplatensis]|uniref:TIR domain-containing protein n=1 Tax=Achromobacter marplatensis TaxID=470868 RepID=UPI003D040CBD
MEKIELINGLESYKQRLLGEVVEAYESRGYAYGNERFAAWRSKFSQFLNTHFPRESSRLDAKLTHVAFFVGRSESDAQRFWREDGEICLSFIDSLVTDVKNDEYDFEHKAVPNEEKKKKQAGQNDKNKVFIVHGHDELTKTKVARFIEQLGYQAIILHEQASGGKTIIEKIEAYTDVGFAIILYTPDDVGGLNKAESTSVQKSRARQNVVFEHGYLIAKLGRDKVVPLVVGDLEMPGDVSGIVYVADTNWQIDVAKEMKQAGYSIDFNKLMQ